MVEPKQGRPAATDAWEREQRAIAARADQQHTWALAGDLRGCLNCPITGHRRRSR